MISYTVGTSMLGYWFGLIVGRRAYHKRSLTKGGNIGTSPLILNEGRTIRGNGVGAPPSRSQASPLSLNRHHPATRDYRRRA